MPRYFTRDHEWLDQTGDTVTVGITDYAQSQLGDVVFLELPKIGAKFAKGATAGVVESVKAASDIYSPISGEVVAINDAAAAAPGMINTEAENGAWLFKLKITDPAQLAELLSDDQYRKLIA